MQLNISDIQATDGNDGSVNLYILCNSKTIKKYASHSYLTGGIITLNVKDNALAFTNFNGTALSPSTIPSIFGYYEDQLSDAINSSQNVYEAQNYFYGPSRFVARKPDELVIVDEGNYYTTENGDLLNTDPNGKQVQVNKNRIVTVSLTDFAITDKTDINLGFEIYLDNSFSTIVDNGFVTKSYKDNNYNY